MGRVPIRYFGVGHNTIYATNGGSYQYLFPASFVVLCFGNSQLHARRVVFMAKTRVYIKTLDLYIYLCCAMQCKSV